MKYQPIRKYMRLAKAISKGLARPAFRNLWLSTSHPNELAKIIASAYPEYNANSPGE